MFRIADLILVEIGPFEHFNPPDKNFKQTMEKRRPFDFTRGGGVIMKIDMLAWYEDSSTLNARLK